MWSCIRSRTFLASFFLTLLAVSFIIGIFAVDSAGRQLSFNDTSPPFEVIYQNDGRALIQINAFSLRRRVDATGLVKAWHFVADFFCIPHGRFPEAETDSP